MLNDTGRTETRWNPPIGKSGIHPEGMIDINKESVPWVLLGRALHRQANMSVALMRLELLRGLNARSRGKTEARRYRRCCRSGFATATPGAEVGFLLGGPRYEANWESPDGSAPRHDEPGGSSNITAIPG